MSKDEITIVPLFSCPNFLQKFYIYDEKFYEDELFTDNNSLEISIQIYNSKLNYTSFISNLPSIHDKIDHEYFVENMIAIDKKEQTTNFNVFRKILTINCTYLALTLIMHKNMNTNTESIKELLDHCKEIYTQVFRKISKALEVSENSLLHNFDKKVLSKFFSIEKNIPEDPLLTTLATHKDLKDIANLFTTNITVIMPKYKKNKLPNNNISKSIEKLFDIYKYERAKDGNKIVFPVALAFFISPILALTISSSLLGFIPFINIGLDMFSIIIGSLIIGTGIGVFSSLAASMTVTEFHQLHYNNKHKSTYIDFEATIVKKSFAKEITTILPKTISYLKTF